MRFGWMQKQTRDPIGGIVEEHVGTAMGTDSKSIESVCNGRAIIDVIPLQVSFPGQEQHKDIVPLEGASQDETMDDSDDDESSRYDSDQELLDRLNDPNWKLRSQLMPRRSARLQARILAVTG